MDAQEKGKGHRERLRRKFMERGLAAFTDEEVLELLLTLGTPRQDCKPMARAAIRKFGSLRHVLEAPTDQLQTIDGIGPNNVVGLRLIHEVARRFLQDRLTDQAYRLGSSQDVFDYLSHSMRDLKREVFKVIFLNNQHRILCVEDLFEGSLTSSSIYPREVVRRALEVHAAALVFAHNHPSGDPKPSPDDLHVTRQLCQAARVMGLRVLDHLIIGEGRFVSLADQGHIRRFQREPAAADGV
jgi:DNA repair protein RadC